MGANEIANLVKAAIGLDAGSIGMPAIEHAVRERQVACGLDDPETYGKLVRTSADELQALIESVVVPETWFFRDREAFAMLASVSHDGWIKRPSGSPLRFLSLPCSSGEEPYSIAMALLNAGIPPSRFEIDAIDVSRRALTRANSAAYGKNSFRGVEQTILDRYFRPEGDRLQVIDSVRARVRFRQGNLFDDVLFEDAAAYDAVFCRNLLIYFDRETQDRAVRVLSRLLAPTGHLFVAPSETALLLEHEFVSARWPLASSFHRAGARPQPKPGATPARRPLTTEPRAPANPSRPGARPPLPAPAAPARSAHTLDEAVRLADAGHFVDAAACCEHHLREHGPSAQAFYLLGLVREASGAGPDAASFYRKALYLDHDHYETLVHFALLMDQQGHKQRALVLRNRARRLEAQRGVTHDRS